MTRLIQGTRHCQIWEAIEQLDGGRRVLKVLQKQHAQDAEQVASLKHEFEVGEKLKHPNVIRMYEYRVEREQPLLAMESFPWPNLKQLLRQEGVDGMSPRVAEILRGAAQGLAYLHEQGWIHRDVKPENFLVNDDNLVKLIDFSIAQQQLSGLSAWIAGLFAQVQGTYSYIAPEQLRNETLDVRADIYSFGCMMYELLTGKLPFTATSQEGLLKKHLRSAPPSATAANEQVATETSGFMQRLMAKERGDRPATMSDVLEELGQLKLFR